MSRISGYTVQYIDPYGVTRTERFGAGKRDEAWAFMRETERQGVAVGFPQAIFAEAAR